MIKDREEIIRKAILEKLSSGFDYFTADDILAVAEIDKAQLKEISDSIYVRAGKGGGRLEGSF